MNVEEAVRELEAAAAEAPTRHARLRAARQIVVGRCCAILGGDPAGRSIDQVVRQAGQAAARPAQRACAVLMVHALAIRGLIPATCAADVCALVESALSNVLVRGNYPFAGSTEEKLRVLERLHLTIDELMRPLEPTFPNWQGLYAG